MLLKNKTILVTGASGFIGSHLVQRLISEGAKVRAMAHYRSDPSLHNLEYLSRDEIDCIEIVKGDIADPFFVRKYVENCDIVYHLAALIAIPYSYIAPASYAATNITGTINILEACKCEGTPRLIHTSTSECYGTAQYLPIDEEHPLRGQSPYSASKISADKMAESYFLSFSLPVVILRPFNTFGPRQSARAVIPTIITQALSSQSVIKLGNLDARRDLTFVTDTTNAFLLAGITSSIEGELIHFGSGKTVSIGELADRILKICGSNAVIEVDKDRIRPEKSEVEVLQCNPAKARKFLDWTPEITLDEGLRRVASFIRQHQDIYDSTIYNI